MNIRKTVLGAIALLALPFGALASPLSNTQILNQALLNLQKVSPRQVDGEMRFDIDVKPVGKNSIVKASKSSVKVTVHLRDIPNKDLKLGQSEGKLSIQLTGDGLDSLMPPLGTGTITGEWRMASGMAYFRVTEVPQALIDYVKQEEGFDPSSLIGVWVGYDMGTNSLPTDDFRLKMDLTTDDLSALLKTPLFIVTNVEKSWKNASGDTLRRVRIRINPTFIWNMQAKEIKEVPHDSYRATDIAAINKRYAQLRASLAHISMAANINVTKISLERFEVGGWFTASETTSFTKVNITSGFSFKSDAGTPVSAPQPWLTHEAFEQMVQNLMPTSTYEEIPPPTEF